MTEWKPGDPPRRVDPPSRGCTDCITGYSVALTGASWQTVKAMIHGDVQDATGTDLNVMVTVTPAHQLAWPDRQTWAWRYDHESIIADEDRRQFNRRSARISADHPMPDGAPVAECDYCTTRITLVAGSWLADDGSIACHASPGTSAAYASRKPKEAGQ